MSIIITNEQLQSEDSFFSQLREIIRDELIAVFKSGSKSEDDELLNYKQAAKLLSISVPTVKSWKAKNIIPEIVKCRMVRFRKSDLIKALSEKDSILNFDKPRRGRRGTK